MNLYTDPNGNIFYASNDVVPTEEELTAPWGIIPQVEEPTPPDPLDAYVPQEDNNDGGK